MRSSISSSETGGVSERLVSAERETAADRPGVAQPVPVRPVPEQPWGRIGAAAIVLALILLAIWEWRMRKLELAPGDLDDGASAWVEQRRRIDEGPVPVAIVGDSRILFDTDLDHFEALTGIRPVQLALPGTNGRPFLQDLAADPDFKGLAIVGIAELSYFRDEVGLMEGALERYRYEAPSQRSAYVLHRALSRVFAFLDEGYRFSKLVQRLDPGLREGTRGPYNDVWKIYTGGDERQTFMWTRLERDARLREHARAVWTTGRVFGGAKPEPLDPAIAERTISATRDAVATIRQRGGDVVFVRPPSSPELRVREDGRLPRANGWDPLLATAGVAGVHFDDHASMQGLDLPEWSHLSRACARVFTDAYVRALAAATPRLKLREPTPAPLGPDDC